MKQILFLGPRSWPTWFKKLLPFHNLFNDAAYSHDVGYHYIKTNTWSSYERKEEFRATIDEIFYIEMQEAIRNKKLFILKPLAKFSAYIYYISVRILGKYYTKTTYREVKNE